MTFDEMRMLSEFGDGYKKLCEETGVYIIANDNALQLAVAPSSAEFKVELLEGGSLFLVAEPEKN